MLREYGCTCEHGATPPEFKDASPTAYVGTRLRSVNRGCLLFEKGSCGFRCGPYGFTARREETSRSGALPSGRVFIRVILFLLFGVDKTVGVSPLIGYWTCPRQNICGISSAETSQCIGTVELRFFL